MTRTRFQFILQNLHFSNNDNDDKTDKSYKIRPAIKHRTKCLLKFCQMLFQSVDEHIFKFKDRFRMKQCINNKPIMWGFRY